MIIRTVPVTEFQQNCRIVVDESNRIAAVIDPGGDAGRIIDAINREEVEVAYIVLTHGHLDHVGSATKLKELLSAKQLESEINVQIVAHPEDLPLLGSIEQQAAMFGIAPGRYCSVSNVDLEMNDGDILQIGEISAKILHTPGHSPGHIVLFIDTESEQVLLAGDTLFAGSVGRTDLPGGSHEALISSIKGKLFGLPDHTRVLPGHGPETTIGNEKKRNPYLQ